VPARPVSLGDNAPPRRCEVLDNRVEADESRVGAAAVVAVQERIHPAKGITLGVAAQPRNLLGPVRVRDGGHVRKAEGGASHRVDFALDSGSDGVCEQLLSNGAHIGVGLQALYEVGFAPSLDAGR